MPNANPTNQLRQHRMRRLASLAFAGAIGLTACGASDDAPTSDAQPAVTEAPATTEAAVDVSVAARPVGGATETDGSVSTTAAATPVPLVTPRDTTATPTKDTTASAAPATTATPTTAVTAAPTTASPPPTAAPLPTSSVPPGDPVVTSEGMALLRDSAARSTSATPAMCGTSGSSLVVIFESEPDEQGVTIGADLTAEGFVGPGSYSTSGIVLVTPPGEEPINLLVTGTAEVDEDGSGQLVIADDGGDVAIRWVCSI